MGHSKILGIFPKSTTSPILHGMKTKPGSEQPTRGRGRPKGPRPPLKSIVNFKGTPEYAEWLKGAADALGMSDVAATEAAWRLLAKVKKLSPPPSRTGEEG